MDSDPEDSDGLMKILDCSVYLWAVNGIRRKKEG